MGRTADPDHPERMTTAMDTSRSRRAAHLATGGLGYCALLIPRSLFALTAALCGRTDAASAVWPPRPRPGATARPGLLPVAGHALIGLLLGAAALVPLGVELAFVLRGVFYGLVDHGPYDQAWGGPARGGAWAAHFLISLPMAAAGILVLIGIAAVHRRLTPVLAGRRPAPWVIPVALAIPVPAVALFIAWLHQI
jgi:hypothetical protein